VSTDYLRKIEIINNSSKSKRVTLNFRTNETSNMLVPFKIQEVSSKKAVETKWICKIDESKGWGVADYELVVEEKDARVLPKSFKMYGQAECQWEKMEIEGQNNGVTGQTDDLQMNQDNYAEMNQNGPDDMSAKISCPVCTLFNEITATTCDICGSPL
jgi:hypothetical protein